MLVVILVVCFLAFVFDLNIIMFSAEDEIDLKIATSRHALQSYLLRYKLAKRQDEQAK